ncbi:uncharacterized protein MONOS_14395 [Monocercomonoides exilis]|uniref:uncharacterized protein n=1 Tax=Monocercomonoides exilis TaxID=2049356 RepID=UPI003559ED76|nr:hypothetical protein MONOS_14395 [Monocercomonoides exilis]|eukprot:MONOS_14395.1-p1 / transcript=MONOS_14395.1 / gene=MONOS_14395 / organism=Monocercomonoides_exilis_PA203 / gene_product=unspecified product / transcript_product=unspecified product / location=Mono_scaffold00994:16806-17264(-) / protein_length=153 / sequence_SO=supercontig / SO=protein_coding / is_pseudo=false
MNIHRETVAPGEKRSEPDMQKQHVNIRDALSPLDQRKEREREITRDCVMEISREDAQHDTTKEDSAYPRVRRQMSERRNEKRVLRAFGTVIDSPIGNALEKNLWRAIADTHATEEDTEIQHKHMMSELRRSETIEPLMEPLPGRLVNRLSEW